MNVRAEETLSAVVYFPFGGASGEKHFAGLKAPHALNQRQELMKQQFRRFNTFLGNCISLQVSAEDAGLGWLG